MKKLHSLFVAAAILAVFVLSSCSKWDEYKQYTAEGETMYTGKMDSVKVNPGNQRVQIVGLLPADPKIVKTKITWNDGRDSLIYNITKGVGIDTFRTIINVPEGLSVFKIQNFDAAGNGSLVVTTTATVYGPKYQSTLLNRAYASAELLATGNAVLAWDGVDTASGAKGVYITYTTTSNNTVTVFRPVKQLTDTLPNFKGGTNFTYRTMYLPAANVIDTFYSATQTAGVKYDITSTYITNAGPNFTNSAGGTARWQTPADWITTADVRNGGNDIGGLDNGSWLPSKALSLEAWWGMTAIPNGKIYQTFTLPAGKYALTATAGDASAGGTKYLTAAAGSTLPDIGNVPTQALAYKTIDKNVDNTINFQLSAPTQVSIGIQGNLPAEGNFVKVFKVRLYSLP